MSTTHDTDPAQFESDIIGLLQGGSKDRQKAHRVFNGLVRSWGFPTTVVGPDADPGAQMNLVRDQFRNANWRDEETWVERNYGCKRPTLAGAARVHDVNSETTTRAWDEMETRATIDANNPILETASPVPVDPQLVDIQRNRAPILDEIVTQSQAGFKARYNVVDSRSDPLGMLSEGDAVDLSGETPQDFGISSATKNMKRYVDLVEISDFAARAEQTLDYMDLTDTTLGQRTIEHMLFKARQIYYGDPSVGTSNGSVEDSEAYEGMAKIADDAGNTIGKSTVSSGFLEDIKSELTDLVENSGLTYDAAQIACSPTMFDSVENEANAVVRLTEFDQDINFGRRSIQIKGVEVFEDPNIRNYGSLGSGTTNGGDNGDVFIYDSRNLQFRELAPFSTVNLGRVGLADRAAMFEYGTLISKSQGNHLKALQQYDV